MKLTRMLVPLVAQCKNLQRNREFIGHESPIVSKQYTHIPAETLRKAANKLPDIIIK